jgi:RNA polymerase sigma-70 factor (ECF subfamily)
LNLATILPTAETLVQQCIDGDKAAYRLLYNRYAKAMYNTSLRIVNSVADAEDILQEAFTDAFLQLNRFEGRSTFGAWLKQIVVFKSISHIKKKKVVLADIEGKDELIADEELAEEEIWYTVDKIKQAVKLLPDGYRTVLSLYLFEEYKQEEIATMLNVTHATVRTQYMRAKQKLISVLKQKELYEQ